MSEKSSGKYVWFEADQLDNTTNCSLLLVKLTMMKAKNIGSIDGFKCMIVSFGSQNGDAGKNELLRCFKHFSAYCGR